MTIDGPAGPHMRIVTKVHNSPDISACKSSVSILPKLVVCIEPFLLRVSEQVEEWIVGPSRWCPFDRDLSRLSFLLSSSVFPISYSGQNMLINSCRLGPYSHATLTMQLVTLNQCVCHAHVFWILPQMTFEMSTVALLPMRSPLDAVLKQKPSNNHAPATSKCSDSQLSCLGTVGRRSQVLPPCREGQWWVLHKLPISKKQGTHGTIKSLDWS